MPNWCENVAIFTHDKPDMLNQIAQAYNSGETMSRFRPCPEELRDTPAGGVGPDADARAQHERQKQLNVEKYGASDWYDWCWQNWGTKWDFGLDHHGGPKRAKVGKHEGKPAVILAFDTAWNPPLAFYQHMHTVYGYDIRAYYSELGMGFVGAAHNGRDNTIEIEEFTQEWLKDNVPEKICKMFNLYEQAAEIEADNKAAEAENDEAAS